MPIQRPTGWCAWPRSAPSSSWLAKPDAARSARPAFVRGPFETALADDELLVEVRVPLLSAGARWGYYKVCRKPGEFAQASAAVLVDAARGIGRCVIGATAGRPIVIDDPHLLRAPPDAPRVAAALSATALADDAIAIHMHAVAVRRAVARAAA